MTVPSEITFSGSNYRFVNFLKYRTNLAAYNLALGVASLYFRKPAVLISGPALGKTHLLHAVGNYVIDHDPLARVALFSSERFVNDFIRAARHSSLDDFRKKYREGYDVALVDDLYATFGIEGSQEELFGVLRHFEKKRKRVVIATSSLPGKDQPHTSSEFMRLLGAATKVKIGAPDYETRTKFIEQYLVKQASFIAACESSRGSLSPKDVTVAILALAGPGFRELEGALLRLETMASINGNDWKSAIEELKIR